MIWAFPDTTDRSAECRGNINQLQNPEGSGLPSGDDKDRVTVPEAVASRLRWGECAGRGVFRRNGCLANPVSGLSLAKTIFARINSRS